MHDKIKDEEELHRLAAIGREAERQARAAEEARQREVAATEEKARTVAAVLEALTEDRRRERAEARKRLQKAFGYAIAGALVGLYASAIEDFTTA